MKPTWRYPKKAKERLRELAASLRWEADQQYSHTKRKARNRPAPGGAAGYQRDIDFAQEGEEYATTYREIADALEGMLP